MMHIRSRPSTSQGSDDVGSEVQPPGDDLPETARHAREIAQGVMSQERLDAGLSTIPH